MSCADKNQRALCASAHMQLSLESLEIGSSESALAARFSL